MLLDAFYLGREVSQKGQNDRPFSCSLFVGKKAHHSWSTNRGSLRLLFQGNLFGGFIHRGCNSRPVLREAHLLNRRTVCAALRDSWCGSLVSSHFHMKQKYLGLMFILVEPRKELIGRWRFKHTYTIFYSCNGKSYWYICWLKNVCFA